jgi:hypothetical protein
VDFQESILLICGRYMVVYMAFGITKGSTTMAAINPEKQEKRN